MTTRFLCANIIALVSSAGLSCASDPAPTRAIEARTKTSGLLGQTTGCSAEEVTKLTLGLALVKTAFQDPRMVEALKQFQLDGPTRPIGTQLGPDGIPYRQGDPENGTAYPEWIIARMTENLPTNVECFDGPSNGVAEVCIPDERMKIMHSGSLANADPANPDSMRELARLLAHELSHNKCLVHFYSATVSSAVSQPTAIVEIAIQKVLLDITGADSFSRDRSVQETTLAPVGLNYETGNNLAGLQWADSKCRGTRVGAGFQVAFQPGDPKPGRGPDSLALLCQPQAGGCWDSVSGERGFPGGSYTDAACACDQVMIGAYGHSGVQLRSVGALCADRNQVLAGTVTAVSKTAEYGSADQLEWTRQCPAGMAVKGMRVRVDEAEGSYPISYLEVICQSLKTSEAITLSGMTFSSTGMGILGVGTKANYVERCLGREVATALLVVHGATSIQAIGGGCMPVVGSNSEAALSPTTGIKGTYGIVPAYGCVDCTLDGWTQVVDTCPSGYALVGFGGIFNLSKLQVQGLQGICANFESWRNLQVPENTTLYTLPNRGKLRSPEDNWEEVRCARGSYLNGWIIGEWSGVSRFQGICRSFSTTADQGGPSFLSFDDPSRPWTSTAGLTTSTTEATQGKSSLGVLACNDVAIDSPLFATYELPVVGTKLAFDIKLSAQQPNSNSLGQTQMFVTIPTAQIFGRLLGNVDLTALSPLGVWKTAEFDLPSDVREALLTDFVQNSSMTIALNTNNCLAGLYIDNVRFTGQLTPRSPRQLACPGGPTCSGHGTCNAGTCLCAAGYSGVDCSVNCGANSTCPNGTACTDNSYCATGSCLAGVCTAHSCAPRCGAGVACGASTDCGSQVCTNGACQAPSCSPNCSQGSACGANNECLSRVCSSSTSTCQPPACSPKCNEGSACGANTDCGTGVCTSGMCSPPSCSPQCSTGDLCGTNAECLSLVCTSNVCVAPSCSPNCNQGANCGVSSDCRSQVCTSGTCGAPACSPSCSKGAACGTNADCLSLVCTSNVCAAPSCSPNCNQGANCGASSDCRSRVCTSGTCGAPACSPGCSEGAACGTNADCSSLVCNSGICR
jgi:hypothetical protein